MRKPNLPPALVRRFALALPLVFGCQSAPGPAAAGNEADPATPAAGPEVAKISKIRGNRGVTSPDLPEGAFLGEGATIRADQWLELPRGTRVELELASGGRLRIDEDSRLRIPAASEGPTTVELTRGRLVVLAETSPIEILAADDRLLVERGEAELHHAGATRHYGVVQGQARLHTAGRDIPLGPGASISTPATPDVRPETPVDETLLAAALIPTLSLAPLQEAAWTAAFDETARLAEDVPQGVGSLVARAAGSKVERQSLRLTEQTVNVTISGRIARTEIEQAFHNDSGQTLEGIYQFPLPSDASISDLQLLVGDTWMRGEMLEKQRAREIFRQIVDATVPRDPALLQWEQGGVFKLNIFPIPGKGERRIKIAYTQVLPAVGQSLRYRYPMGGSGATATEIGDFQFNVTVDDAGLDAGSLAEVSTPMAELQRREGEGELQLSSPRHTATATARATSCSRCDPSSSSRPSASRSTTRSCSTAATGPRPSCGPRPRA
jgi:mannose-6-phosphate isomerase-like protein (cupin superfamily)